MSKDYARSFYGGRAWRTTQAAYMMSRHYVCESCGGAARIVHHVKRITPQNISDPDVTLNWDNLMALCAACHSAVHMGGAVISDGLMFDGDGDIIPLRR